MRKHLPIVAVLVAAVFLFAGCAAWDALSPDEKARATVDMMQIQLEETFDQAKAYVELHPEYADVWKAKVVPAFDLANKALADAIELAQKEQITPADIRAKVNPLVNRVIIYLHEIGFIK